MNTHFCHFEKNLPASANMHMIVITEFIVTITLQLHGEWFQFMTSEER